MPAAPVSVVETPEFISAARTLLDDDERMALVDFLASHPDAGDLIQGTGGVRKLRWALEGRGKRGGARVIYFFHNRAMPLFLLTAYAKNVRSDIGQAEKKAFRTMTKELVASFAGKRA